MLESKPPSLRHRVLVLYFLLFYAVWAALELLLVPHMAGRLPPMLFTLARDVGLKCLVWLLPAWLLIRHYDTCLAVPRKALLRPPDRWGPWMTLAVVLTVGLLLGNLIHHRGLVITPGFGWDDVLWVLFVGLTEETAFRGWLLNALLPSSSPGASTWRPIAVTSLLFLLIHFPIWLRNGSFLTNLTSGAFLSILLLSVIFSVSFVKSRTLLVPVTLHSLWDLLVTLLA